MFYLFIYACYIAQTLPLGVRALHNRNRNGHEEKITNEHVTKANGTLHEAIVKTVHVSRATKCQEVAVDTVQEEESDVRRLHERTKYN